MAQEINFQEVKSKTYEGKGQRLEYKLEGAIPEYSHREYMQRNRQDYRPKYYREN